MKAMFGTNLRHYRRMQNLSQETLADRCGIFRTYLSRIETGKGDPSLTVLAALAAALGMSVHDLLVPHD